MKGGSIALGAALLLGAVTFGQPVSAAPGVKERQQAARLVHEAKQLVHKGELHEAVEKYRRADELAPEASHKVEIAKLLSNLGDFVAAAEILREVSEQKPASVADRRAIGEAKKVLLEVEAATGKLEISVFEPEAGRVTVSVDDEKIDPSAGPHPVNPGKHEVRARADGYEDWEKTVRLDLGEVKSLEVRMTALPAREDTREAKSGGGIPRWSAYAAWGVGAVGLGLGIGFGIAAIQATNEVRESYGCDDDVCDVEKGSESREAEEALGTALLNGNVSTAGFVIAGIGAAGGAALFLLSSSDGKKERAGSLTLQPLVAPTYLGVAGRF